MDIRLLRMAPVLAIEDKVNSRFAQTRMLSTIDASQYAAMGYLMPLRGGTAEAAPNRVCNEAKRNSQRLLALRTPALHKLLCHSVTFTCSSGLGQGIVMGNKSQHLIKVTHNYSSQCNTCRTVQKDIRFFQTKRTCAGYRCS